MARVVLDSSAVIALLKGEPGSEVVKSHLDGAMISAVNVQEVAMVFGRKGMPFPKVREMIDALQLDIRAHDVRAAYAAAQLWSETSLYGSGLGDRSCLALGIAEGLSVLTTDQAWAKLSIVGLVVKLAR